eukprot:gene19440-biopygen961
MQTIWCALVSEAGPPSRSRTKGGIVVQHFFPEGFRPEGLGAGLPIIENNVTWRTRFTPVIVNGGSTMDAVRACEPASEQHTGGREVDPAVVAARRSKNAHDGGDAGVGAAQRGTAGVFPARALLHVPTTYHVKIVDLT